MGVREMLARRTAALHSGLDNDPVIGGLMAPDLDLASYRRALGALRTTFSRVETARLAQAVWPQFAVGREVAALSSDLATPCGRTVPAPLQGAAEVLGALYVMHGAAFGARVVARHLRSVLPEAPMTYFTMARDARVWSRLIAALEGYAGDPDGLEHLNSGASTAFRLAGSGPPLATRRPHRTGFSDMPVA